RLSSVRCTRALANAAAASPTVFRRRRPDRRSHPPPANLVVSADFPARLVECLLDVSHTLLDLAFDLLRHTLHLLLPIAGRLANFLLYFAGDILDASFDLVLVHLNLRSVDDSAISRSRRIDYLSAAI